MGSGSRAASCLCCPFKCLACGLFSCLCSILVSLLVTAGVLALILYFIFRPQMIAATVDSASLTQFALGPANPALLQYNLSVDMTVRNPNKRVGLYYDRVEALALFDGQRFGFAPLDPFFQGHQASTDLKPAFGGQHVLDGDVTEEPPDGAGGRGGRGRGQAQRQAPRQGVGVQGARAQGQDQLPALHPRPRRRRPRLQTHGLQDFIQTLPGCCIVQ
ncbi:hypothetical protein ZWY2020_011722 [Hordeum vulgare]|nr:hypothetical protein ZWY2020_011722 [Hordeum vulgare]